MSGDVRAERPIEGPAIDRLVRSLREEIARDPKGVGVAELLSRAIREDDGWRDFVLFDEAEFTRNLIERNDDFELLMICWSEGQESPIHNHEGQDCWMAVLDGRLEEVRYAMPPAGHTGPLDPSSALIYETGQVGFIRDEIGLHLVRPAEGAAISLHLYARPYGACDVYCPETGRITRKELVDHSYRGRRTK